MTAPADVCLLLEGTYPYVPGGVSAWVDQIVRGMPDTTFSLVHLSPTPQYYRGHCFEMPANVVGMVEGYLSRPGTAVGRRPSRALAEAFCAFMDGMRREDRSGFVELADALPELYGRPGVLRELLHGRDAWRALRRIYFEDAPDESFVDFYWNWISIHRPLLQVLSTPLPEAGLYHSVSTGYAGLLAAVAKQQTGGSMLLTEHGIYAKERRIEIHAAEWLQGGIDERDVAPAERAPYFRRQWNRQFEVFSRICYEHADRIVTLFEGNRREQLRDGAPVESTMVVPNGIDARRFTAAAAAVAARTGKSPFTVGFAGRIAPIKDLRTFLSAMRLVAERVPDLRVQIMGPADEDPHYARECRDYVRQIGMTEQVNFAGRADLSVAFGELDLLVLTSISEAQPLVVLEAGAAGLPVVCTDVGACAEMICGSDEQDRAIGPGGMLTAIASPGATARAVLQLWENADERRRLGANLQRRVQRSYGADAMIETYRELYARLLPSAAEPAARAGER